MQICHKIAANVWWLPSTHWITIYLHPYILKTESDEKLWCNSVISLRGHKQIAIQCLVVYSVWLMADCNKWRKVFQNETWIRISRNESENLSDFGFAKNYRNPTTFGFELRRIPSCITRGVPAAWESAPGKECVDWAVPTWCIRPTRCQRLNCSDEPPSESPEPCNTVLPLRVSSVMSGPARQRVLDQSHISAQTHNNVSYKFTPF